MARFSYRKLTVLSTVAAVALLGVTAILGLCILSKFRVPVSVEEAVLDTVIAFNNQPIRVAEEMNPKQYFDDPKILELCHAISEKQHDRVRELMPTVDLNTRGTGGINLLYWAYFSNDIESFKLLLQAGADPDLRLKEGYRFKVKMLRPLLPSDSIFFACLEHRRYDFFFAAVPYTDDVNQKGAAAQNFLHRAIVYTPIDRDNLARLVDLRLDMNSRDSEGKTILVCATRSMKDWIKMQWILELAADRLSDEMLNRIYDEAEVVDWTTKRR